VSVSLNSTASELIYLPGLGGNLGAGSSSLTGVRAAGTTSGIAVKNQIKYISVRELICEIHFDFELYYYYIINHNYSEFIDIKRYYHYLDL